jgi:hypothetical protein
MVAAIAADIARMIIIASLRRLVARRLQAPGYTSSGSCFTPWAEMGSNASRRCYGASSTCRQDAGRSAIVIGGFGFGGSFGGCGCSTPSLNQ